MIFLCILLAASSFLNGATDAANTVTGAVCSGILKPTSACALAAVMEALGNALSCALLPSVAMLISDMADLPRGFGGREEVCIAALCAVAVWSAAAWAAGLPTSEGHGLMAALAGCAVQAGGTVSLRAAAAVFIGLAMSVLGGALSLAAVKIFSRFAQSLGPQKKFCIASLCASAFLHGAQDGQKFVSVGITAGFLSKGASVLLCAVAMALGTLCGGGRIVRRMGIEMTHTDLYTSCCADAASAVALAALTFFGIPVSTTHIRMSSLAFAAAGSGKKLDKRVLLSLCLAWVTTFPACYYLAKFLYTALKYLFDCA